MKLRWSQNSGIPGHAQNTSGRAHWRSVFMRSRHPSKASLLQARPKRSPRTADPYDAVCTRERERPRNKLFGQRQPARRLFSRAGHQQGKGAVGACWSKFSTILHSLAPNTGSAPASLRDRWQVPAPPFLLQNEAIGGIAPKRKNWEIQSFLGCTLSFHKN